MSWIFHEPFEPAIYARRAFSPLVARRGFGGAARFAELDLFTEETSPNQRRPHAPVVLLAAGRPFRRPHVGLDAFLDDPWTGQRRTYAPAHAVTATAYSYSPAGRVLATLIGAGVYDDTQSWQRPARFALGSPPSGNDVGRSASFTMSFAGAGVDPNAPAALGADTTHGLQADPGSALAVKPVVTFGGVSASRVV